MGPTPTCGIRLEKENSMKYIRGSQAHVDAFEDELLKAIGYGRKLEASIARLWDHTDGTLLDQTVGNLSKMTTTVLETLDSMDADAVNEKYAEAINPPRGK